MATSKKKPTAFTCSLSLEIKGVAYEVTQLAGLSRDSGVARAFRLKRVGAEPIVVADTIHGPVCDCGDWTFRREGTGEPCKHIRACQTVGIL